MPNGAEWKTRLFIPSPPPSARFSVAEPLVNRRAAWWWEEVKKRKPASRMTFFMKSKLVFTPCEPFALFWSLHFLKKGPQLLENKHTREHKHTHTEHCNGLYFLISVTGVFCACVCARVCAYWGVLILLIAKIRYLDTQIICIHEQSYCYQEDDVIMMVIFTLPGAGCCPSVFASVCVCACACSAISIACLCLIDTGWFHPGIHFTWFPRWQHPLSLLLGRQKHAGLHTHCMDVHTNTQTEQWQTCGSPNPC